MANSLAARAVSDWGTDRCVLTTDDSARIAVTPVRNEQIVWCPALGPAPADTDDLEGDLLLTNGPILTEFRVNDDVCLLEDYGEIRAGTCGRVIGRNARPWNPSYLVIFEGDGDRLRGVRPEQIALAKG